MGFKFLDQPEVQVAEVIKLGTVDGQLVEVSCTFEGDLTLWIGSTPYSITQVEYDEYKALALVGRS